jgi:hypothetical protein
MSMTGWSLVSFFARAETHRASVHGIGEVKRGGDGASFEHSISIASPAIAAAA